MPIEADRFRLLFPRVCGSLSEAALSPLLDMLRPKPFAAGEHLCRQGAHTARAVFILRGEVEIRASAPTVAVTLGVLEPGGIANIIPLIDPAPAEFDIVGRTSGAAVELTHGDFLALRHDFPHTARAVLHGFISDLSGRLRASELAVGPQTGVQQARQASAWLGGVSLPEDAISPREG